MDYDSHDGYKEEYSGEISPGYRQDVRSEEGHRFSPFMIGIIIFAAALLLLITFVYLS